MALSLLRFLAFFLLGKQSISFMAMERPSNSCKFTTQVCLHFRRKLYVIYCQNNKWNKISLCWWRIILHVSINEVFLLCFFSFRISFDHLPCYLEPTLFRELTREPTGSFSFLAYTLFLIQKMHIDKSIIKIILFKFQLLKRPSSFLSHLCLLWSLWFLFLLLSHSFLHSHGLQRYLKQENAYKGWKREWGLRDEQSPHVRQSKKVLDSGLHAVDSEWIPVFVQIPYYNFK